MSTILRDEGLWIAAGVAFALVGALVAARALTSRWWCGAGGVATVAALVGDMARSTPSVPRELVVGIVLLGAAGAGSVRWSWPIGAVVAVPGGVMIAAAVGETAPAAPEWVRFVVGVAAGVTALASRDFDNGWPRLAGLCFAITSIGVLVTVPDTEAARALVGAACVAALLGLAPDAPRAPAGSAAVAGVIAWNVGVGGWPRPGAVIGGVACAGVLMLGPLLRWARTRGAALVGMHVAVVAVVARVAGFRERALVAAVITAAVYGAAIVVIAATAHPRSRGQRGRRVIK